MKTELTQFLDTLKYNKKNLTRQQYRTIRGQALKGDVMDARKGLQKVLKRGVADGKDNNGDAACAIGKAGALY